MPPRETQHTMPCAGLQEIVKLHAVLEERVDGIGNWQRQANGNIAETRNEIKELRAELQVAREEMARGREERAVQYGAIQTSLATIAGGLPAVEAKTQAEGAKRESAGASRLQMVLWGLVALFGSTAAGLLFALLNHAIGK